MSEIRNCLTASYVSGGSPIRGSTGSGSGGPRHPNDLDVTSFLPALTTEYADIMDESKYFLLHKFITFFHFLFLNGPITYLLGIALYSNLLFSKWHNTIG